MVEDIQDQPLIEDLDIEDSSLGIMRTNTCTTEFIPRINVKELRFDPYYVSVSYLQKQPLFCPDRFFLCVCAPSNPKFFLKLN